LRHWLAAIWHLNVDSRSIAARAFARRYGRRANTSWEMLSQVRDALVRLESQHCGIATQILGREALENEAWVCVASDGGVLTVLDADEAFWPATKPCPQDALWSGHLRAWLVSNFRGVSSRYLYRYLAEFAARHGEIARRGNGRSARVT